MKSKKLSRSRFRTVIKDTKDTAFVFLALTVGMASGTSNYFLAFLSTLFVSAIMLVLVKINYGAQGEGEFAELFNF